MTSEYCNKEYWIISIIIDQWILGLGKDYGVL